MARPRVSCRWMPTGTPSAATCATTGPISVGTAVPMVSASPSADTPASTAAPADVGHRARIDRAVERAAEGGGEGELDLSLLVAGQPGHATKPGQPRRDGLAGVLALMGLGHRDHPLQMAQTGGQGPLRAPFVEDEPPARDGLGAARGGRHHLLGVGHGRHPIRADERGQLQLADAGGDERLEQLELRLRRDRRFVLKAVAQGDVAEHDHSRRA